MATMNRLGFGGGGGEQKKRIHWQSVITRKPQSFVYSPARPDSAKEDLKRFVQTNHLQYRYQRPYDDIDGFEDLFKQLNLNEDDSLLERADRRDLPVSIQLLTNRTGKRSKASLKGSGKLAVLGVPLPQRSSLEPSLDPM